ncbi:glycosyltransferase [Agrococcus casei]|uniref:glycosyltransferase n=1 Tax=Agrococcus casei TaxID=343512 RepID=UPI003F9AE68C
MSISPDISVVIGFRNWGIDRIRLASESILASFGEHVGELIISDYGSDEPDLARTIASELGAKFVYTGGDPNWSRSRALNAGFEVATGKVLVSTDADMVFSPTSMSRIAELSLSAPHSALFLQCRDLPDSLDATGVQESGFDWDRFERESRLRPRWGMGGMMAVSRRGYEAVRGFDDRLHTYGGEDLDFAQRLRRAGFRTVWIDEPEVRMYHMWHPSSRAAADATPEGKRAVDYNRSIVYEDKSFIRNTTAIPHAASGPAPLVTISIVTHNRAELLREAIWSVLAQTVQDFEIVIVDDGSTDDTAEVVASFNDPRIRYFFQEQAGIASARNRATAESRGTYTAVLDDDDLAHPQRLEWQLEALDGGAAGSVGSFVNFNDESGDMHLITSQIPTLAAVAEKGGAPGHGTWLVRTDHLRRFRYDENLTSGVDNDLMLRMVRSGLRFVHSGKALLLRRTHAMQVTQTDATKQGQAATRAHSFFTFSMTAWSHKKFEEIRKDGTYPGGLDASSMIESIAPFRPDHLVSRSVRVHNADLAGVSSLHLDGELHGVSTYRAGLSTGDSIFVERATLGDLARLASAGLRWEMVATNAPDAESDNLPPFDNEAWLMAEVDLASRSTAEDEVETAYVLVSKNSLPDALGAVGSTDIAAETSSGDPFRYRLTTFRARDEALSAMKSAPDHVFLLELATDTEGLA